MPHAMQRLRYDLANESSNVPVDPGGSLPLVTPVVSQSIYEKYGVQIHVNFRSTVYGNISGVTDRVGTLGANYIRSNYIDYNNHAETKHTVDWCRANGVKWLMIVYLENGMTSAELTTKLNDIRDNAADVCYAVESINEPNHNRDGSPVDENWAQDAYDITAQIWDFVAANQATMSDVKVVGPSLHDVFANNSYTQSSPEGGSQHWHQLEALGIRNKQDIAGIHRYPGGFEPLNQWDARIAQLESAYGAGYPVWVTETGYHNAVNTTSGNRPVDEATSSAYAPRALLELCAQRDAFISRYELMDDYDPSDADVESAFGLWRVDSSDQQNSSFWTPKPEATTMESVLSALKDPGVSYTPNQVGVRVEAVSNSVTDIKYVVTSRRDSSVRVWLWRDQRIWDPINRTTINVPAVGVEVEDQVGTRTIQVDGSVTQIDLR